MTAEQEFGAWVKDHAFRAERAGWKLAPGVSRNWVLLPAGTTQLQGKELWDYVIKFGSTQPACRSAVEFIAKWNPDLFRKAMTVCNPKPVPDWLELLAITAELRA